MGTAPFVAAKLPTKPPTKLPKAADAAARSEPGTKVPADAPVSPTPPFSAAERLRRLEEAMAFLRQHLAAGPQPARKLLKTARAAGIAERTLHRAKDLLGVTTQRRGGYAEHGQWVWYPPAAPGDSSAPDAGREAAAGVSRWR